MRLEPRATEPGLWVNSDCGPGTPGTFAVVIGVSRYGHLDGGDAPAAETYGLGQLRVSALTAFRVFRWLANGYRVDGCPLSMCWLLLSPTDDELAHEPAMRDHLTLPTFDNCRKAIRFWYQRMTELPQATAEASRAIFFWSGHGLEVHQDQQILLPADYLAPPAPALNDAISTQNLKLALASLAVPRHFLFLDACRNDHHALRAKKVRGAEILNEDEAALVNPGSIAPLLYATASGQQAFQQPEPKRGLSIFGQALLDGLAGTPDIELECAGDVCSIRLYPLQGYVEERVVALLQEAGAQVVQPVRLGGVSRNEPVTYLDRRAGAVPAPPPRPPRAPGMAPVPRVAAARADRVEEAISSVFTTARTVDPGAAREAWARDFSIGHDLFGSERVTEMWSNRLRVLGLGTRRWRGPETLVLHRVERREDTRSYRVELSVAEQDPRGHWLELTDTAGGRHGVVLPDDVFVRPRYVVELDVDRVGGERRITRIDAALSRENPGPLGIAAHIWQRYLTADVGEAVSAYELSALEDAVRGKVESPLAATVASLVLLRANRLDLLHDWVRNLATWFPERPDGAVLWAEQSLRQQRAGTDPAIAEAAEFLALLLERGLPHTSEALGYAAVLTARLLRGGDRVPDAAREKLVRLRERLDAALAWFSPGGLFASYAWLEPALDPRDLLGPW